MIKNILLYLIFFININCFSQVILTGTENPPNNSIGGNGDFYINHSVNKIFGPKTNNLWNSGVSLNGKLGTIINTNLLVYYDENTNNYSSINIGTNLLKITNGTMYLNNNYYSTDVTNILISTNILNANYNYNGFFPNSYHRDRMPTNLYVTDPYYLYQTSFPYASWFPGDNIIFTNNFNKKILINIIGELSVPSLWDDQAFVPFQTIKNYTNFFYEFATWMNNVWPNEASAFLNNKKINLNYSYITRNNQSGLPGPHIGLGGSSPATLDELPFPRGFIFDVMILNPKDEIRIESYKWPLRISLIIQSI